MKGKRKDLKLGGRPKDPIWQYFTHITDTGKDGKRKRRSTCNFCGLEIAANPNRMKTHIIERCKKTTAVVKRMVQQLQQSPKGNLELDGLSPTTPPMDPIPTMVMNPPKPKAVASSLSSSTPPTALFPPKLKYLLCYGDSLTWGWNPDAVATGKSPATRLPYELRWTSILHKEVTENGIGYVIPEGLNGRTSVFEDPLPNGMYSTNGRSTLMQTLHSHKPVDIVILQLGTNELIYRFNLLPIDIAQGVNVLVQDIKKSNVGSNGGAPDILVISPPRCRETAKAKEWGFHNCDTKSLDTLSYFKQFFEKDDPYLGIHLLDTTKVLKTGKDGIHLDINGNAILAHHVYDRIRQMLAFRESCL